MSQTNAFTPQAHKLVNNPALVAEAITELYQVDDLYKLPPSLYIDVKGVNISRSGRISLLQIHALSGTERTKNTYVFDIHLLGEEAFDTPVSESSEKTLRAILTSPHIPKAFFDCRKVNDALYNIYDIDLAAHGACLANSISEAAQVKIYPWAPENYSENVKLSQEEELRRTYFRNNGGSRIFENRPLDNHILGCCLEDVILFPRLWEKFSASLSANWKPKVNKAVLDRLSLAHGERSTAEGGDEMAFGPLDWYDSKGRRHSDDKGQMIQEKRKTAAPRNSTKRYLGNDEEEDF